MFKPLRQADESSHITIKIRHDTDTIYVLPDKFVIDNRSFELREPFEYKIVPADKFRTVIGYVVTDAKGATCIHVESIVAPDLPPVEPRLTQKEKEQGKKPKYPEGGRPNRILSAAHWFAETHPDQQPPSDAMIGERCLLESLHEHTAHCCLFRVLVPEGDVDLDKLTIDVWTSAEAALSVEQAQQKAAQQKTKAEHRKAQAEKMAAAVDLIKLKEQSAARRARKKKITNERLKREAEERNVRRLASGRKAVEAKLK